jgi:hypothetical protein
LVRLVRRTDKRHLGRYSHHFDRCEEIDRTRPARTDFDRECSARRWITGCRNLIDRPTCRAIDLGNYLHIFGLTCPPSLTGFRCFLCQTISFWVFCAGVELGSLSPFETTPTAFLRSMSTPHWSLLVLHVGISFFFVLVCFSLFTAQGRNLRIWVLVASFVPSGFLSRFVSLYIYPLLYGDWPWQF